MPDNARPPLLRSGRPPITHGRLTLSAFAFVSSAVSDWLFPQVADRAALHEALLQPVASAPMPRAESRSLIGISTHLAVVAL
jgi:hypothetical protein